MTEVNGPLLAVRDLHVTFATHGGQVQAVRGTDFAVHKGECLALVGESGSGKSVTAQSVLRLIPTPPGRITRGQALFGGRDLLRLPERALQRVRGAEIGMIFQDPMTALNPTLTIGYQVAEGLIKHRRLRRRAALDRAAELLALVGIPNAAARLGAYPHQFSGGMRQRAVIAAALAARPRLLIADEPTTALDVTIQAQILALLKDLQRRLAMSIILITHDLGVVAGMADRVAVMYAGRIVEQGPVDAIFSRPRHPYTWGLLASVPRLDGDPGRELPVIPGSPPDLFAPPPGCAFAPRCSQAMRICHRQAPDAFPVGPGHLAGCWLAHPLAPAAPGAGPARSVQPGVAALPTAAGGKA